MEEMLPYEGPEMAIGRSPEDFLAKVETALAEDSPVRASARRDAARHESWDDRVEQVSAIVAPLLDARPARKASSATRASATAGG
jgi:hypothetical protein